MANSKSVNASLWWDPFCSLLTDLENASLSSHLSPTLEKKLNENHAWFVDTVKLFKPQSEKSREALNSQKVNVGSHELNVKPELKEKALDISTFLGLDEVQSYIIVERAQESQNVGLDVNAEDFRPMILIQYYIERQCLLKCTRQIVMHALNAGNGNREGNIIREEARKLISDGLESKLILLLEDQLSSKYPEHMDVDFFTLWAEETLIEENLIFDIVFLVYYESFSTCSGERWKKLCSMFKGILSGSYNFGKLAVSAEAHRSSHHCKVQLLLILMETLDLENLLQMVHDQVPLREGTSIFSLAEVQEMDASISSLNAFETKEAGPLILTWAVFLCLISSLPRKEENDALLEIDHVNYVRQAVEASSFNYFLEILRGALLRESDGPVAGYLSVLRTSISAFIASYEINLQSDNGTLGLILDVLCNIYRGEESLCVQFWDRDSFIDGPIRCLLLNLESEFPFRSAELVKFLSALCEGPWPAECVYNFLHKSAGISSIFGITTGSLVQCGSDIVETSMPQHVCGIEGLVIPSGTQGCILKSLDENTALVRWEYPQSGILILLLQLAQQMYMDGNEEILLTLDLFSRMVSFNMAICFAFVDVGNYLQVQAADVSGDKQMNFWVVQVISALVRNLSPSADSAAVMSMCVNILSKMLKCFPSQVVAVAQKADIFGVASNTSNLISGSDVISSGTWLLSGKLAKMLLIDCEHNDNDFPLAISVLDFTMQLLVTGVEDDSVLGLVALSLQYVLVNHEYWKYRVKRVRWRVTLKVLEVMKKSALTASYSPKLSKAIHSILLSDTSIHSTVFRIICTTGQALEKLSVSRLLDPMDLEGLELAICSVLEILFILLCKFSKDASPGLPVFHQALLSSTLKPIPIFAAVLSFVSYFRNPTIQVGAFKLLSALVMFPDFNACICLDEKQILDVRHSINCILLKQHAWNEDLYVAVMSLLTAAAYYQPAFLVSVFAAEENMDVRISNVAGANRPTNGDSTEPEGSKKSSLLSAVLQYVERSNDLFNSNPRVLLNVLNFLKVLWQGASHYAKILECLKNSKKFWKQLSDCVAQVADLEPPTLGSLSEIEALNLAYKYQSSCAVMEIMGYEIFLQKKLLLAGHLLKQAAKSKEKTEAGVNTEKLNTETLNELEEIISSWSANSVLSKLIKLMAYYEYNNSTYYQAKVATSLLAMHVMGKLGKGDTGSLSVSLVEKMHVISNKLINQPVFSELSSQYAHRGYSEGKELKTLILNDLYYHLQGEFEGRSIGPGPFKELFNYLLESKFLQGYHSKYDDDLFTTAKDVYLYDTTRVQADLGLNIWDYSDWKKSKPVAETVLRCMQDANFVGLLARSKLHSFRALTTTLTIYRDALPGNKTTNGGAIPTQLIMSCIDLICQCFHSTTRSLPSVLDGSENILSFTEIQAELLFLLMKWGQEKLPLETCVLILKSTGSGLRVLSDLTPSVPGVGATIKLLLRLLLLVMEDRYKISQTGHATDKDSVENCADISNICLGLLPILCRCITTADHGNLSLTAIDVIMKYILTPDTWIPIIQKHLPLQLIIFRLQDRYFQTSVPLMLKFFLTLASVRDGAEMLLNANFFPCLKVVFAELSDDKPFILVDSETSLSSSSTTDTHQHVWGLGLAVAIAIIHSIGETSACNDVIDDVITYFFLEKGHIVSYYLSAPEFSPDDRDRKRARAQRRQVSLTSLRETEQTLVLMCLLVKQWRSWVRVMTETDSELREKCIHLLAFISRVTERHGESPRRAAPLLYSPVLKEEFDSCKKPAFVRSRNGWFALSHLGCQAEPSIPVSTTTALVVKGQVSDNADHVSQTYFSDTVAVEIYRITFFLLRFLCLQVHGAARRAEEVGFVDLAHFPELPMPEILHGLQDQAVTIVRELCEANKLKHVDPEIQRLCLLLLQIMEMALYLELCVGQICGMRPVLGRVEDFSKEVKLLMKATEGHVFLKASVKSLKQIISLIYPGLLQTEGFL